MIEVKDDYIYPGTDYFVPVTNKEILEKLDDFTCYFCIKKIKKYRRRSITDNNVSVM